MLYATPTQEQVDHFWYEVKHALADAIAAGALYKNETRHIIEVPDTKNSIRAKTAWNADTLRGDYADDLILDEFQLMSESAWEEVGAPMLIDHNGDAVFIYTPLSLRSRHRSKAKDVRYAAKLFKKAATDTSGLWEAFHFSSLDNPFNPPEAIEIIASDMTRLVYEQEILAEDKDEAPGSLWKRAMIDDLRRPSHPELVRIVIGVDPPGGRTECGIVAAGLGNDGHGYVLEDASLAGSPEVWSSAVVEVYYAHEADRVLGEKNYGGDMVQSTIRSAEGGDAVSYKDVQATRGKAVRAEPVSALYERGKVHHVGNFQRLEDEMCEWVPDAGMLSPNRMDALVWALTELMLRSYASPDVGA